ncbi:MAG: amidohydrolase family protein, partial [Actinomycetota bacterium]
ALIVARLAGGPNALDARRALELATRGGARCLGRDDLGALETGMRADLALWRLDDLGHAGIEDPVAALVLGPARRVECLLVEGRLIVENGVLVTADESSIASEVAKASRKLLESAA